MADERPIVITPRDRTVRFLDDLETLCSETGGWWTTERRKLSFRVITPEGGTFVVSVEEVD